MDAGNIARPNGGPAPVASARAEALTEAGAAKTELAPEMVVQQAGGEQALRFDRSDESNRRAALEAALGDVIRRQTVIDARTRELVVQSVDERTGNVVSQFPEETLLKLRAFAREMREAQNARKDASRRSEEIA